MTMVVVAVLASFTSFACMVLLFRAYARSGFRLLLWSALCFVFLTINNLFLFVDLTTPPTLDFRPYRLGSALVGLFFLLYGFIWEAE
jgi:hypothetical protein